MNSDCRQSGSALIAVLCLIFTAGMLITAVAAMSQYNTVSLAAHTALQRSFYINEGCASRIQWLIEADRTLYATAILGDMDYSDYAEDRYLADGVIHQLDYYGTPVEFVIYDAASGYDFSAQNYLNSLEWMKVGFERDTEWTDRLTQFGNRIGDYIDSDDDLAVDGMEYGEYEELGREPLPRNAAIQFREELFYLPDAVELLPPDSDGRLTLYRLIPPENTSDLSGTPSLFSASPLLLMNYCNLTEEEAGKVMEALELWRRERIQLSDQLDTLLLNSLNSLSRQESGSYTVVIRPPQGSKWPSRRLVFSFTASGIGGPADGTMHYLEWLWF